MSPKVLRPESCRMNWKPPTVPMPFWLYYFNVGDIDVAMKRVKAGRGQILSGPVEVLGNRWILRCTDPQGAIFALQGKRSGSHTESPVAELSWAAEWGGFASRGRVVAKSARDARPPRPGVKTPGAKPKR